MENLCKNFDMVLADKMDNYNRTQCTNFTEDVILNEVKYFKFVVYINFAKRVVLRMNCSAGKTLCFYLAINIKKIHARAFKYLLFMTYKLLIISFFITW